MGGQGGTGAAELGSPRQLRRRWWPERKKLPGGFSLLCWPTQQTDGGRPPRQQHVAVWGATEPTESHGPQEDREPPLNFKKKEQWRSSAQSESRPFLKKPERGRKAFCPKTSVGFEPYSCYCGAWAQPEHTCRVEKKNPAKDFRRDPAACWHWVPLKLLWPQPRWSKRRLLFLLHL